MKFKDEQCNGLICFNLLRLHSISQIYHLQVSFLWNR